MRKTKSHTFLHQHTQPSGSRIKPRIGVQCHGELAAADGARSTVNTVYSVATDVGYALNQHRIRKT
jgi:hypothetical protein